MSDPPWRLPLKLRGKRNWQSLLEATEQSEKSDVAPTTPATGPNRGEEVSASLDVQVVREVQVENGPIPPLPASSIPNPSPSADGVSVVPHRPPNPDDIPDSDATPPGGSADIPTAQEPQTASRPEVGYDMNIMEPFEDDCAVVITLDSDSDSDGALVIDEGPDVPDEVLDDCDGGTGESSEEPANRTSAPERASTSPGQGPSAPAFQEYELPRKRMKLATSSEASRPDFGIGSEAAGVYSSHGGNGRSLDGSDTPTTMHGEGYIAYVNAEIERRLRESSPSDSAQRHPNDSAQPDHSRQPNNSAQQHSAMVEGSSSKDPPPRAPTPAPRRDDSVSPQGAPPKTDDPDDRPPPLVDVRTMDGYPFRYPIPGPVSGLPPGLRPAGMNGPPFRHGHLIGPWNSNGASQAVGAMPSTSHHLSAPSGHVSRFSSANEAGPSYRAMQPPGYFIPPPVRNPNSGNLSQPPWDPRLAATMQAGPSQAHQQPNRTNNASEASASSHQMQMPPGDQRSSPPVAHSSSSRPDHAPKDPRLAAMMQAGPSQAHQQPRCTNNASGTCVPSRQMQMPPDHQRSLLPVAHSSLSKPDHAPRDPRLATKVHAGPSQAHQQPNRNNNTSEAGASSHLQRSLGDQRSPPPVAHSSSSKPDHANRDPRLAAKMHAGPPQAHQQPNCNSNFSEASASSRQMLTPPGDQRSLPPVAHSSSGRPDHVPRDPRLVAKAQSATSQSFQHSNNFSSVNQAGASRSAMQVPPPEQKNVPPSSGLTSSHSSQRPRNRLAHVMRTGDYRVVLDPSEVSSADEGGPSSGQMQTPPPDQRSMPPATRPNLGDTAHAPMRSHVFMRGGPPQPPIRINSASAASLSSFGLQPLPQQFIVKPRVGNPNSSDSGQVPCDPRLVGMERAGTSQMHQNLNWNRSSDRAGTSVQMRMPPPQDVSTPLPGEPNSSNSNQHPCGRRWVVKVQQGTPQVRQPASQVASTSEASTSNCQIKIPHPGPIDSSPSEHSNSGNSSQLPLDPCLEPMMQSRSSQPLQCPSRIGSAIGAGTSDARVQMPHHRNSSMLNFENPRPGTSSQLRQDPLPTTMMEGRPPQPQEHPDRITNGAVAFQIQQFDPVDLSIPSARNQCPGSSSQLSQDLAAVVQSDAAPPVFKIPVCPPKSKPVRSQSNTKQKPKPKQNLRADAITNAADAQGAGQSPPVPRSHLGPVAAGGVLVHAENWIPPADQLSGSAEVVPPPQGSEASRPLEAPPDVSPPVAQASDCSLAGSSCSMAGNGRPRSQKPSAQKCDPSGSSKLLAPTGGSSGSGNGHPGPSGSSSGSRGPGAQNGSTTGSQNHRGRKGKSSVSSNHVSQKGSSSGSQSSVGKSSDPSGSRDSGTGSSDAAAENGSPGASALQVTPRPESQAFGSPIPVLEPTTDDRTQHIVVIDSLLGAFAGRGVLTPKEIEAVKLRIESEARLLSDASASQSGTSASAFIHELLDAQAQVDGSSDGSNSSRNVAGPSNQVAESHGASSVPAGARLSTVDNGPVDVESPSTVKNCGKVTGLGSDGATGIAVPATSASVSNTAGIGLTDPIVAAVAQTHGSDTPRRVSEDSSMMVVAQDSSDDTLADASGGKNNAQEASGGRSAATTSLGPPTATPSASSSPCGTSTAGSSLPKIPKISSGITVAIASTAVGLPSAAPASTSSESWISWAMAGYPQGWTQDEVGETSTALTPTLAVPVSAVQSAMSSQPGPSGHMSSSVAGPPKKAKRPPAKPKPAAQAKSQKGATRSYKPRAKKSKTPAASQQTFPTNQHSTPGGMRSSNPDVQSVGPHGPHPGPQPSVLVTAAPGDNFLQYGTPTGSGPSVGGFVMPPSNITAYYAGNPPGSVANGVMLPNSSNNFGYPENWNVVGASTAVNTIPSGAHQKQAAAWGQMGGPSQMNQNHAAQYPAVSYPEAHIPSGGPQQVVAGHLDQRAASVSQTVPPYPPPPYIQPSGVAPRQAAVNPSSQMVPSYPPSLYGHPPRVTTRQAAGNRSIRPAPPPVASIALPSACPSNSSVSQNQALYGQYPSSGGISLQARPTTGPPLLHLPPPSSVHYQAFSMDMRNTVGGQCGGSVTLRLSPISLPTAGPSGGNFQFPAHQVQSSHFPQSGIQSVGHGAMAGLPPPQNLAFPPAGLHSQVVGVNYSPGVVPTGAAPQQLRPAAVSTASPSSGNFRPLGNQAVAGHFLPPGVTFHQSGLANGAPLPHLLPSSSQFYTYAVGTMNQAPGSQTLGPTTYHLSTAAPPYAGPSSSYGHPSSHIPASQSAPSRTQSDARTDRRLPLLLPGPPPIYTKAAGVNMRHGAPAQASGARIPHPLPAIPPATGSSSGNFPRNVGTGSRLNPSQTMAQPVPSRSQSILAQLLTSPSAPIIQPLNVHRAVPRTLPRSAAVEHGLERRRLSFSRTNGAHGVQQQEPNGFPKRPPANGSTQSHLSTPSSQESVMSNATNSPSSGLPSPSLSTPGSSETSSSSNPSPSSSGSEGSSGIATLLDAAYFLDARANGGSGESDAAGASGPAGIVQAYFIYQIALEIVGLQQMFATKGKRSIEMKADVGGLNVNEEEDDYDGSLAAIVGIPSKAILHETMKLDLHRRLIRNQELNVGNPDIHTKQSSSSWVDELLLNGAVSESDGYNIGSEPVRVHESLHGAIGIRSMGNILRPNLQQYFLAAAELLAFHLDGGLCLLLFILVVTLLLMLPNVLGSVNLTLVYGNDVFNIANRLSHVIGRTGIDGGQENENYDVGIVAIQKFLLAALFVVLMSTTLLLDGHIRVIHGSSDTQIYAQTLEVKLWFRCAEQLGRPSDIVICSFVWNQVQLGHVSISEYLLVFLYFEASNPFEETCNDCEVQD